MKIGIDLGGTKIEGVLVSNGKVLLKHKVKTGNNKKEILSNLVKVIKDLRKDKNLNIGIGIPGRHKNGKILFMPNIPQLAEFNLKYLEKEFECKIAIENDAACFTLAEHKYGAAKGCKNVLGITLGTGIGGGIIINNKLYTGKGFAGEIGHIVIDPAGERCGCGLKGDFESWCSASHLQRKTDVYKLKESAHYKIFIEKLSDATTSLANILDPDIIVIGGGMSEIDFYDDINKKGKARIVRGRLESAGAIGAALLTD